MILTKKIIATIAIIGIVSAGDKPISSVFNNFITCFTGNDYYLSIHHRDETSETARLDLVSDSHGDLETNLAVDYSYENCQLTVSGSNLDLEIGSENDSDCLSGDEPNEFFKSFLDYDGDTFVRADMKCFVHVD